MPPTHPDVRRVTSSQFKVCTWCCRGTGLSPPALVKPGRPEGIRVAAENPSTRLKHPRGHGVEGRISRGNPRPSDDEDDGVEEAELRSNGGKGLEGDDPTGTNHDTDKGGLRCSLPLDRACPAVHAFG